MQNLMKEGRNLCSDLHTQLDLYKILKLIGLEAVRMVEKLVLALQAKCTNGSDVDSRMSQLSQL